LPKRSNTSTKLFAVPDPFCAVGTAGSVVVCCSTWFVPAWYVYANDVSIVTSGSAASGAVG
jgi:hypothetical protein